MKTPKFFIKNIALLTIVFLLVELFSPTIFYAKAHYLQNTNSSIIFKPREINPEFIEYRNKLENKELEIENSIIPSTFKLDPANGRDSSKTLKDGLFLQSEYIPEKYDLRTENRITPVKNQVIDGLCWAFASNGAYESNLKKTSSYTFSELHMGYSLSNTGGNTWGYNRDPNGIGGGGNSDMSAAYYLRWSGPVLEADDPYNTYNNTRPISLTNSKPVAGHCQNVIQIPPPGNSEYSKLKNREYIKQTIIKHGAVSSDISYDDNYCKYGSSVNTAYFYNGPNYYPNHAILIVGWDDSYSPSNFKFGKRPSKSGAYLVKNSWGTSWGSQGYFYISYEDKFIGEGATVFAEMESVDNYDNIYQYDPLGRTDALGFGTPDGGYANIFHLAEAWNEELSAVGFYVNGEGARYEIWINENNENISKSKMVKSGAVDMPGYYTINLDQAIPLVGVKFVVAVKLCLYSGDSPVAIEKPNWYYSESAKSLWGQSFVTDSGVGKGKIGEWKELTGLIGDYYRNSNTCIKAYTNKKNLFDVYENRFEDVTAENSAWAKQYIDNIARAGIINGSFENDGWYYKPNNNITRAEFASIIVRLFGIVDANATCDFNDINNHWAYSNISSAVNNNLIKGVSTYQFKPDNLITREDMCTIISRSLMSILSKPELSSDDADIQLAHFQDQSVISQYARMHVANGIKYQLINGYLENDTYYFKPKNNATRAEVAKVIYIIYTELMG